MIVTAALLLLPSTPSVTPVTSQEHHAL
jgi:hypothetical protein